MPEGASMEEGPEKNPEPKSADEIRLEIREQLRVAEKKYQRLGIVFGFSFIAVVIPLAGGLVALRLLHQRELAQLQTKLLKAAQSQTPKIVEKEVTREAETLKTEFSKELQGLKTSVGEVTAKVDANQQKVLDEVRSLKEQALDKSKVKALAAAEFQGFREELSKEIDALKILIQRARKKNEQADQTLAERVAALENKEEGPSREQQEKIERLTQEVAEHLKA